MFTTIAILLIGSFTITVAVLALASVTDGRRKLQRVLVTRPIRATFRR
jgi:hypothetical protein